MPQDPRATAQNGHIDLARQRKRAKQLLKQLQAGTPVVGPSENLRRADSPVLADAQWLIARELGFASWPKLKSHVDAVEFAARHPQFAANDTADTQHWRCGNDIAHSLGVAGFRGEFHVFADPYCMGPVPRLEPEAFIDTRCEFISQCFGIPLPAVRQRALTEYGALSTLSRARHAVLWCEADAYDQLFLIAVLANMTRRPELLELVEIDSVPGVDRFVGLGQLAPQVLAWLWPRRRELTDDAFSLAREAWDAYRDATPLAWAALCKEASPSLPLLAPALRRQLQELPSVRDGLGLTERLALETIRDGDGLAWSQVFAELYLRRDPLPFLGDAMFDAMMRPLVEGACPLIKVHDEFPEREKCIVGLTPLGEQVLQGKAYWQDHCDVPRWVGGTQILPRSTHWALDDDFTPVQRRRFD
ncbi:MULTISPECIES: DUF1835 domain-containing protein [Burkholderia]|uniref:DUF1835 domain-containing protein n=1 Tax=Burkholderia aenigmatica TaxID=2015348 RepID=A0ABY6XZ89_9BURK|nr:MULTISPECIES: DUF1835 domain-containing protein [Burkholderia]VWD01047.1 hypothetical protein BLA18628_02531 [Burkholderia aenigmatica]VWD09019.1 hypothetical protein BLA17378_05771 [Burkholderia aenigmatica]